MPQKAPYGTWVSPITSDEVTAKSVSVDDVVVDEVRGTIYHLERRPAEGRTVLVKTTTSEDIVPTGFDVRTKVQEYGGGAVLVRDGAIYASNFDDRHLYRFQEGKSPEIVTPESAVWRYADFTIHPSHPHLLVGILEDHTDPTPSKVLTRLVVLDTSNKQVTTLVDGADFYNSPRFNPSGTTLAWTQWYHPDMPWEGAQVYTAPVIIAKGDTGNVTIKLGSIGDALAGEANKVAANYPYWSPSGATLHFISDKSGFANPWVWSIDQGARPALLAPIEEEFGVPAWHLDEAVAASLDEDRTLVVAQRAGRSVLYVLSNGILSEVSSPFTSIKALRKVGPGAGKVVFIGKTATAGAAVILATFGSGSEKSIDTEASTAASFPTFETLYTTDSGDSELKPEILSKPEALTVNGPTGPIHIIYWAPLNPRYEGSSIEGELPPCVFSAHGGPTGFTDASLNGNVAYFTSRGWAWCEVNYGGSSGYGRAYTDRLRGQWGVVDVQDMLAVASSLSSGPQARIDPKRLTIRGGSSGGFTVLATLVDKDRPGAFGAGASYYGISDLRGLVTDTHKFESRYMEKLIGGTYEDIPDVYTDRSPVTHADRIVSPLIILQGSDDAVVPPAQSEIIVKAVKDRGGEIEYIVFEGEGHGFRKAENLKKALESEIGWYEKVFDLHLKDDGMSLLVKDIESMGALPLEIWSQDPRSHFRSLDTLPNADDPAIRHALASVHGGSSVRSTSTRSKTDTSGNHGYASNPDVTHKRKHWEGSNGNHGHGNKKKKKGNQK